MQSFKDLLIPFLKGELGRSTFMGTLLIKKSKYIPFYEYIGITDIGLTIRLLDNCSLFLKIDEQLIIRHVDGCNLG